MENKIKRLELENSLSQIYDNNYVYDGPFCSFSFDQINFIAINDIYFYTHNIKVELQNEYLYISGSNFAFEMKYKKLDCFLINFKEVKNV